MSLDGLLSKLTTDLIPNLLPLGEKPLDPIDEGPEPDEETGELDHLLALRIRAGVVEHFVQNQIKCDSMSFAMMHALVGWGISELKGHLQAQFTEEIHWDTFKDWEIDHIHPKSKSRFKSVHDQSFRDCWSLNNLRPISKMDNRRKWANAVIPGKEDEVPHEPA
jgi:hypothetical protein